MSSHFSKVKIGDVFFADVLYDARLVLARLNPINPKDPFTQEEIKPENQVVTSYQHQFDVEGLFDFIKLTPLKALTNPFTNVKFSERDKQTILKAVNEYAKRENRE